ncbi:MAG: tRNA threonylcarbamoyladenosine dehydratase [Oscillospiraceae bacterium]|nr:tRNA threonylcarbamoyladenosine dehydratase [Oscillospiraceae bacterium]
MESQFQRLELLIGKENVEDLSQKHVIIFGVGGVGGYTAEALARSGVGKLTLVDNDTVNFTNLNRQIIALHSTIGRYKTEVMKERIADINPDAQITVLNTFFTPENSDEFDFSQYDYVVDAIDTVTGKIEIIMKAQQNNVPVISSMGAGNKLSPAMFEVADIYKTSVCPLARVMRYELKRRGVKHLKVVYSKEEPRKPLYNLTSDLPGKTLPGSSAFVPSAAGLIIASEIVKDLTGIR